MLNALKRKQDIEILNMLKLFNDSDSDNSLYDEDSRKFDKYTPIASLIKINSLQNEMEQKDGMTSSIYLFD